MITLAQAKIGMADKVDQFVVDEFRRGSFLLDSLEFDNVVSPGTGGSTLAYGYVKLKTPSTASFRPINSEYTSDEAIREQMTAHCKIFGGNFKLDRVIINTSGAVDELDFQMKEKVRGAINLFHHTVINGDSAVNQNEFDGLDSLLTGSSTEYNTGNVIDISTSATMDSDYNNFLDMVDEFTSIMEGRPFMFLANNKLTTKMNGIARRAGYYTQSEDAFGRPVSGWDNIPIIDLEYFYDKGLGKTVPCVPVDDTTGETSLYAIQLGQDAFHGIAPIGNNIITTNLPDLNAPGVIKEGDIEMIAGVVLKNSLKSGVFRKIKVG